MSNYNKLNFVNGSPPALNATNLNHMESGIADAHKEIDEAERLIAEKEDVANKAGSKADVKSEALNYPSIRYLKRYYYDQDKVNDLLSKKENTLSMSATFDKNGIPLSVVNKTTLSAGDFSSGSKETVTAFISSYVTSIQSGALSGCTNLTDVYIDNAADHVTVSSGAIPPTAKIHYKDTYNSLSQIENALHSIKTQKADVLPVSVTFDKNGIPLSIVDRTKLSAGDFSSGSKEAVTAFIPSSVTSIQGGSLSGCTNLTDVYIDNTADHITISDSAIPPTAKIHYKDTYNSLPQIEYALKKLSSSIDASTLTGKISVKNLPDEAFTKILEVINDETRLRLTTSSIQDGDFIKVESTGKTYIVKDSGRLGTEGAFIEISSSVDSIDASAIKGTIPIENLPMEALTRLVTVGDDAARLALDKSLIQNGDFVKVESTGKIYIVKDSGRLGREDAFVEISGGSSSNNSSIEISTTYDDNEELLNIKTTNAPDITGTIPVGNLPPEALTRLVKVDNETARMLLTDETVQDGDFVKVESTNKTYIVYDSSKLGTEEAFEEVTGTAISASYDAADQSILL